MPTFTHILNTIIRTDVLCNCKSQSHKKPDIPSLLKMEASTNYYKSLSEYDLGLTVSSLIHIYQKLAHYNYEKQCAIVRLNPETLVPIMKLLGTEDRKNARLACQSFKEAIDLHVGINVTLDQRKINEMKLICMPPPGASSIRLWSINSSKYLDHILKRPNLTTSVLFAGQVSLSAFTKILSRCKNLQKISFTDRSHMYANIIPMRMEFLHTLDIGCPGQTSDYVGEDAIVPSLWLTYEMLMRRLIAPNLQILRIYFCCVEECSVLHNAIAQIFRFLAVHDKVKEFSVNIHHRYERFHFLESDINYRKFRIEIPKKVLRRIQLQKLHVETMEPAFKVWDSVLPGQRCLTHLDVLNRGRRWFYFSKIVSHNYATLTVVRLHNVSPKRTRTPVLNAGIFENCNVLETLFLSRFENSTQEIVYCYPNENSEFPFLDTETSKTPEMENLTKLPVTLKNLHLQGIILSTAEICEAIPKLENLELLELQLCGYHNPLFSSNPQTQASIKPCLHKNKKLLNVCVGLGVTSNVLQIILSKCRKLETLFIEEFENPWTMVRDTDLGDFVNKISHIAGDGYFTGGAYYGILICSSVPGNSDRLTRSERMHLWGVRLSQYCLYHHESKRRNIKTYARDDDDDDGVNEFSKLNVQSSDISSTDEEDEFALTPAPSTCLLEILDKENGQLEQIHRLLHAESAPPHPVTPTKSRTENTQTIAREYYSTLFSAIPNFHKASRLQFDPTEKFASFFPRSKSTRRNNKPTPALQTSQNSQNLSENEEKYE